jgi:hypothetical protein
MSIVQFQKRKRKDVIIIIIIILKIQIIQSFWIIVSIISIE